METNNVEVRPRTTFIGGSDAAGVLGRSRWKTPLSVWAEKTGQIIFDDSKNSDAKDWGKRHEPTIIQWFQEKTGKKIIETQQQMFHPAIPFIGCTFDGLIDGEDAGFEAKTADAWKSKEWEGEEIPEEYILQAYHSMLVTGLRKWYIAVLIGGNKAHWKAITWDNNIINRIRETEIEFWTKFVIPKVMPTLITKRDGDVLSDLFPAAVEGKVIKLNDGANVLVENLQSMLADKKNLDGMIDGCENELKALIGDAEAGETGIYRIGWKNVRTKRFDVKAFEVQYPNLAAQFKPETISRRFSYKPLKGE